MIAFAMIYIIAACWFYVLSFVTWDNARPIFAWYDCWVGVFVDRKSSRLYVFPLPMLGMVFELRRNPA